MTFQEKLYQLRRERSLSTIKERQNPDIITPQRKRRIAAGAGVDISEVNKMMKQFEQMRKIMKSFPGMMGGKGKKGKFKMPF